MKALQELLNAARRLQPNLVRAALNPVAPDEGRRALQAGIFLHEATTKIEQALKALDPSTPLPKKKSATTTHKPLPDQKSLPLATPVATVPAKKV